MNGELNAQEAIFAFCGWLSCRDEKTIFSASDNCSPIVERIKEFCEYNQLPDLRPGWEKKFKHPSGTKPLKVEFFGDSISSRQ